jgi:hypothetical protein
MKDKIFVGSTLAYYANELRASKDDIKVLIDKCSPEELCCFCTDAEYFDEEISKAYINKLLSFEFKPEELYRLSDYIKEQK